VRFLEDEALVQRLHAELMPPTVSSVPIPMSTLCLCHDHNIRELLQRGLCASIHADDPACFGGYIGDNYKGVVHHALQLEREEIMQFYLLNRFLMRQQTTAETESKKCQPPNKRNDRSNICHHGRATTLRGCTTCS
jgi:adenosine deaminase